MWHEAWGGGGRKAGERQRHTHTRRGGRASVARGLARARGAGTGKTLRNVLDLSSHTNTPMQHEPQAPRGEIAGRGGRRAKWVLGRMVVLITGCGSARPLLSLKAEADAPRGGVMGSFFLRDRGVCHRGPRRKDRGDSVRLKGVQASRQPVIGVYCSCACGSACSGARSRGLRLSSKQWRFAYKLDTTVIFSKRRKIST